MEFRTWPEVLSDWNMKYVLGFRKTVKEKALDAWEFAKQLPLTIVAPLAILGIAGFTWSYNHEYERDRGIPLAFSEKTQIENDISGENKKVSPLTRYLTSVNDSYMKIFERWNKAHGKGSGDLARRFAEQLYDERTKNRHHYSLHDLLENLPEESKQALDSLRPYREVKNRLIPVHNLFEKSWDDRHIDTTHMEPRVGITTVSDGKGGSHTETYIYYVDVYDYTTHYYTYSLDAGEKASSGIDGILRDYPTLKLGEHIRGASRTNTENEKAMHESRSKELKDKVLSTVEKLTLANKWRNGSTLLVNLPSIHRDYNAGLKKGADLWRTAKQTAHSTSYRTYHHSDSGPREFQIAEQAVYDSGNAINLVGQIENGAYHTMNNSLVLDKKITELIRSTFNQNKQNGKTVKSPKILSEEVMSIAKEGYKLNFKEGFDVTGFRTWVVVLGTLLGLGVGAGIGFGIENYRENRRYNSYY